MSETGPAHSPQYTPPSGPSGPRANFGWRLLAWFVDTIITGIGFAVLFFGLAAIDEGLGVLGYILGMSRWSPTSRTSRAASPVRRRESASATSA